jgi:predicted dehydrogenase
MSPPSRRQFLSTLSTSAIASGLLATTPSWAAASPNERFRVGIIGCGNQGTSHFRSFDQLPEAEVVYVCDIDPERVGNGIEATGGKGIADLRKILDDPNIDGVTIALPDHWHVPAALLALSAGKHVYVEKPACHNFREGQMLAAAVKASGKTLQHGTQARSSKEIQQAIAMLHDGIIGDVLAAKCWNWQTRGTIGHAEPTEPPAGVDYDTWVGPAEWMPYQKNRFHYDWHWWYNFGAGDLGNDGVHEMDYAIWGLGVKTPPKRIAGTGGIYLYKDDRQWPDTQQVNYEYETPDGPRMLIYEQRLWSNSYPYNVDSGAEYYGTKGKMFISKRGKFDVFNEKKERVKTDLAGITKPQVFEHIRNWIQSAKEGKTPNAPLEVATLTTSAIHLGNISTRLQRSLVFDADKQQLVDDSEANELLGRKYRAEGHWSVPKLS